MRAADGETFKLKIVQRGAVPPLIEMLSSADAQLKEMAAFALGRLAQNSDNQAGVVASGGLPPLLDLLESQQGNLQVRPCASRLLLVFSPTAFSFCFSPKPPCRRSLPPAACGRLKPRPAPPCPAAQRGICALRSERQRGQPG